MGQRLMKENKQTFLIKKWASTVLWILIIIAAWEIGASIVSVTKTNTGEHSSASVSGDCGGILHPTGICRNERHDGGSDKRKGHNITCIASDFIRNRCRIRTGTSDEAFRTCGKDAFPISDVNPADPGTRSCTDYPLHHRGHQQEPHHHCRHLKFLSGGNQHTGRFQIRAAGKTTI